MFYTLSKVVWALVVPSTFLVLLVFAGLVVALATPFRAAGLAVALGGMVAIVLVGYAPIGTALISPLEERFPMFRDPGRVDGIVVLGGGIQTTLGVERDQLALGEASERVVYMGYLARRHPEARLVFAGGGPAGMPAEADVVRRFADVLDLPADRILFDRTSRNTAENAENARALVSPKPGERWLLVTSARHMPRAVGCFRRVGFDVTAYPVDYITSPTGLSGQDSIAGGLGLLDEAAKEWLGLVAYRLTGRTSELYPSPSPAGGPSR